jgi:hypothetical protein
MNPVDRDDDFELRLQRKERFVPQFDAELDGPDEAVDRAVLARARATLLQPPAAPPRFHRAPRWTVPLALAATVLLSFTLVMQMDSRDVIAQRTAERADSATVEVDAGLPAAEVAAAASADASAETQDAPVEPASARPAAPAPAAAARVTAAPAPAPAPPPPPPPLQAPPPSPLPAIAAAGESYSAPLGAAAPLARGASSEPARRAAPSADRSEVLAAAEAPAPAGVEPPEAWLERIEVLRAAGDLAAARRELAAFRRQHPDTDLPPALRPLLEP